MPALDSPQTAAPGRGLLARADQERRSCCRRTILA